MANLHNLKAPVGAKAKSKRKGRGDGSNKGSYSGRGLKGQKAKGNMPLSFEGGQTPLVKKLPFMRGFHNPFRKTFVPVNLDKLEYLFKSGEKVNPKILYDRKVISKNNSLVKILGNGNLTKPLVISAHGYSNNAKDKIEKAGGSIEKIVFSKGND